MEILCNFILPIGIFDGNSVQLYISYQYIYFAVYPSHSNRAYSLPRYRHYHNLFLFGRALPLFPYINYALSSCKSYTLESVSTIKICTAIILQST